MNTNEQAQAVVEYVRVNSREPKVLIDEVTNDSKDADFDPEEGYKVFFDKCWQHHLDNGDTIELNLKVVDIEEGNSDYVVAIGGGEHDHKIDGFTRDRAIGVSFPTALHLKLKQETRLPSPFVNVSLFIHTPHLGHTPHDHNRRNRSERVSGRDDREREAMDSIQELLCSHLDDIIAQATILKTADQRAVKSDAYARIRFAMARLESLEQTSVYDIRPRYMSREKASEADRRQREQRRENRYRREHGQLGFDVDRVYRQSTDSYYTPDGQFIETSDEATAKAWYGDASPESMERLRRDREVEDRDCRRAERDAYRDNIRRDREERRRGGREN